jgi:hypothetical protein
MVARAALLVAAFAAGVWTASPGPLPPPPKVIHSNAGDVRITWVQGKIDCGGVDARGCYTTHTDGTPNTVEILRGMSRERTWQTILHEQCHAALDDQGVTIQGKIDPPGETTEDAICDALATARVEAMQHGH